MSTATITQPVTEIDQIVKRFNTHPHLVTHIIQNEVDVVGTLDGVDQKALRELLEGVESVSEKFTQTILDKINTDEQGRERDYDLDELALLETYSA